MEKNHKVDLSVLIPVFNEQDIIPELYVRLKNSVIKITDNYELIFINDGSCDNTLNKLNELSEIDKKVKYISFSRNFGHQIAVSAGIDHCNGDSAIIIDGDLQDPPELFPELYNKYKDGFNVVYAKRLTRKGETFFKKTTAKIFYRFLKKITAFDIPVDTGDFRLIDRKIINLLKLMPERNKFLRGQIAWLGFKQTYVEFQREKRQSGKTGYSLKKMLSFAIDGITSFSDRPLKFVTFLGLTVSFVAFFIIIYAIFSHFIFHRTITGWTSIIISSMFIGGIQLVTIGIIGEYISRINNNILGRPLYIIEKTNIEKAI